MASDLPNVVAEPAHVRQLRHVSLIRRLIDRPEVGAAIGLAAVWVFFAIFGGGSGFLTERGTATYLDVATQVGIIGTTVTLLLIGGEFDLSIGSMVGFAGMIIALGVTKAGWPLWLSLLVALAFALAYGFAIGWLVMRTGIASFIITLGGLFLLRGATIGFSRTIAQHHISAACARRSATTRCCACFPANWCPASTPASPGGWR